MKIFIDRLMSCWERSTYEFPDNTTLQEIQEAVNWNNEEAGHVEDITETYNQLSPTENDGQATEEIHKEKDGKKILLWDNSVNRFQLFTDDMEGTIATTENAERIRELWKSFNSDNTIQEKYCQFYGIEGFIEYLKIEHGIQTEELYREVTADIHA